MFLTATGEDYWKHIANYSLIVNRIVQRVAIVSVQTRTKHYIAIIAMQPSLVTLCSASIVDQEAFTNKVA